MSVEIEARVRRANLVSQDPHLERLYGDELSHRLLRDVYSKKEGRMSEMTDRPEQGTVEDAPVDEKAFRPTRSTKTRSPAFVPAILTAVIAVGVIVALVARQPAPVADTPIEVAEAFMAALNEYDGDAAMSLVAENAVLESDTEELMRGEIRIKEVQGWAYHVESCVETLTTEHLSRVLCSYSFSNDLTRALGTGPYEGNSWNLLIEDGQITATTNDEPDQLHMQEAIGPFLNWVTENHPEAGDMYWHYLDEDNLAKWEQYLPEFLASLEEAG